MFEPDGEEMCSQKPALFGKESRTTTKVSEYDDRIAQTVKEPFEATDLIERPSRETMVSF